VIDIQRLQDPFDPAYSVAWDWMQAQPQLYEHLHGFDDFEKFVKPDFEVADFALLDDGKLIGFAAMMYRGPKRCQFCLITPPKPKMKRLLLALKCLQAAYFLQLSFNELYIHVRPLPQYNGARKLAKRMGWHKLNDDLWVMTLDHFIQDHISREENQCQEPAAVGAQNSPLRTPQKP
jgi:hypothetical protein